MTTPDAPKFNQPSPEYVRGLASSYSRAVDRKSQIEAREGPHSFITNLDSGLQGRVEILRELMGKFGQNVVVKDGPLQDPIRHLTEKDIQSLALGYRNALQRTDSATPECYFPVNVMAQYEERERILEDLFRECRITYTDFLPPEPPSRLKRTWDSVKRLLK